MASSGSDCTRCGRFAKVQAFVRPQDIRLERPSEIPPNNVQLGRIERMTRVGGQVKLSVRIGATSVELDALSQSVRQKETNIGNFVADSYRDAVKADIGFVNGGSIRADLTYQPGPLTKRDVLSILPFNNPIIKIQVSGKLLKQILEHSVARSGPGEDNEPGRFAQVSGVRFKYDSTKSVGSRIVGLSLDNSELVDDTSQYTIATSDFLYSRGGDGYTMLKNGKLLTDAVTAPKDSDVFEAAIKNSPNSTISPVVDGRITKVNK